ncbi:TetR family transcriptional regulator C-terminal domain-containing protein [Streptomyces incarnatus]|uniref:TetR family transcriptional regulator C-terminal domain-containing protein n=1 Tax=Streptomyces incarnatus TaxID=665007 RepID=UPI000A479C1C|nr:TetR family transcriptional regulator C-terminal domain-containing protein [Streptomyces incarnatus]
MVERTRARVAGLAARAGPRAALGAALRELLPLDEARLAECRVYVAFAARAATSPHLAAVQRETLAAVHAELRQALSSAPAPRSGPPLDPEVEARLLLAVVDGLMLDAVSAPGVLTRAELESALDTYLDRLTPGDHAGERSRRQRDV